ncbi:MAG: hypothetical protein K8T10_14060 [Candidatus Eremiobacteraeota bacterium]|nr:hypothetical protein [Candidatus Eremiobacteraeota bacterium]
MKTESGKRKYRSTIVMAVLVSLCLLFIFPIFSNFIGNSDSPSINGISFSKEPPSNIAFNGEEIVIAGILNSSISIFAEEFFRQGANRKFRTRNRKGSKSNKIQSYKGISGYNFKKKPTYGIHVCLPLRFCHTESYTDDTDPS